MRASLTARGCQRSSRTAIASRSGDVEGILITLTIIVACGTFSLPPFEGSTCCHFQLNAALPPSNRCTTSSNYFTVSLARRHQKARRVDPVSGPVGVRPLLHLCRKPGEPDRILSTHRRCGGVRPVCRRVRSLPRIPCTERGDQRGRLRADGQVPDSRVPRPFALLDDNNLRVVHDDSARRHFEHQRRRFRCSHGPHLRTR